MNFDWMQGAVCTAVTAQTEHSTAFRFDVATLVVESLWRVTVGGRIRRTSNDHRQQFGLPQPVDAVADASKLLSGRRIVNVRVDVARADMAFEFDSGVALEIITDSAGYESWTLSGPGRSFVGGSGGTVHDLTPEV